MKTLYGIEFVDRAEWGAKYGRGYSTTGLKPLVIIHHSDVPDVPAAATQAVERAAMRAMEDFHVLENEWSGIAYNWLIFQSGRIYEGRGWSRVGAHTENHNSTSVGICFVVDGDVHDLTHAAIAAGRRVIDAGVRYKFIAANYSIRGHHDYAAKTCPGTRIYPKLAQLFGVQPLLRIGDRGSAVKELQKALGIVPADGIFGLQTEAAVKAFQFRTGATPDGIVGSNTWRLLLTTSGS